MKQTTTIAVVVLVRVPSFNFTLLFFSVPALSTLLPSNIDAKHTSTSVSHADRREAHRPANTHSLRTMPTMIAGLLDTPPIVDSTEEPNGTDFLSLPPEVREMIYTLLPEVAQINITQHYPHDFWVDRPNAKGVNQPAASQVCRLMRQECLDVFYGKTDFMLDLHSWPHIQFPATWNPLKIFEQWISGIGNENAGRLRSVTFMSHCFSVHLRWSKNAQHLTLKFLPALLDAVDAETKEGVNWGYTYELATSRAEQGLRSVMDRIISERAGTLLRVDNFKEVGRIVNKLPPFICRRHLVLFGAFPQSDRVEDWPAQWFHLMKCRFCRYVPMAARSEPHTYLHVLTSGFLPSAAQGSRSTYFQTSFPAVQLGFGVVPTFEHYKGQNAPTFEYRKEQDGPHEGEEDAV